MDSTIKTIWMPKDMLAKWLEALRSGEYKQARESLCDGKGYCCLGVLQKVVDGRVETQEYFGGQFAGALPTKDWLKKNQVVFLSDDGTPTETPALPALGMAASEANDNGRSFAEIADAIEACAEGV